MKAVFLLILGAMCAAGIAFADESAPSGKNRVADKPPPTKIEALRPEERTSEGSVAIGGSRIDYQAVVGTLVVHPKGWDDAAKAADRESDREDQQNRNRPDGAAGNQNPTAEASMFYAAYFKKDAAAEARPVTFLYNGGPGSSTVWLHMGAFGPKRVVTADDTHSLAAPYAIVDNDQSLLDASDLVFVDAPGTGFSRISGKDKEKAFYGVDADAHAFAEFITEFLSKYGRWNSPKYLFGESYGTTRSAALINLLETDRHVDFNGVILLSQILNFDLSRRRSAIQSRRRSPLSAGAADLCGDGLVPPQADRPSQGLVGASEGGRAFRHDRLRPGAPGGGDIGSGSARHRRRQTARLYRTAGRIHQEGRPAHQWRRVPQDLAG